jgi:hypothetical protein
VQSTPLISGEERHLRSNDGSTRDPFVALQLRPLLTLNLWKGLFIYFEKESNGITTTAAYGYRNT